MISLVISYYRSLPNLRLILHALSKQSYHDFEVIIAEDDESLALPEYLTIHSKDFVFPILHVHQPDLGFRKCKILNAAIRASSGDFLVFIDGDCIPHRHFIREYTKSAMDGFVFIGRRVLLDENLTLKLLRDRIDAPPGFWQLLLSSSKKRKEAIYFPWFRLHWKQRGMKGMNWGIAKNHLLQINGYDEDYTHAGVGEDVDIFWRLRSIGLTPQSMKNRAIVYHLFHLRSYSESGVKANYKLLADKKKTQGPVCLHGIHNSEANDN
jgi:glycosyltransferase involved in cell wall biosynthesis